MPEKTKRTRRTKAQLTAAKLLQQSNTLKQGAAALSEAIQIAPPTNLLGKVSRAVLGAIAVNWEAVTGGGRLVPYPFTLTVKVIGREALIEFDYTHVATNSHTVLLDDGERDLPLEPVAPAPANSLYRASQTQDEPTEEELAAIAAERELQAEREALGRGDVAL